MENMEKALFEQYQAEAKERWGNTKAYAEYEEKTAGKQNDFAGMELILAEFAACKKEGFSPESEEAKALAKKLQSFITEHFYTCTDEILKGLGVMYTADRRFLQNIDRHGEGTADFIGKTIEAYCS